MKKISSVTSSINSPLPSSLASECKKAAKILNSFIDPGQGLDKVIPANILENAQGLAIYSVVKAGFLFSLRGGSGLVVARMVSSKLNSHWWIRCWRTDRMDKYRVMLIICIIVAAGPLGRNAEASGSASLKHIAAIYAYSKTRGLFAGVSLEGSVVVTRGDANEKLYGRRVTAKELLNGSVTPPPEADALYRALNAKFHTLGNTGAMYQRGSEDDSSPTYKSTNISARGSLRQPPPVRQIAGYGAPTLPPPSSPYSNGGNTNTNGYNNNNSNSYGNGGYSVAPPTYTPPTPNEHSTGHTDFKRPPPPPPPASRKPAPPRPSEPTARAVYAFVGEQEGDLSFNENDIITIVQKSDSQDDWWTGKIGSRQGVFPANYVQLQ
ncbi:uncharacterized protein BX664DRAFT_364628 [Halteromyces radiatus]|uniref:uncharacterized protein n=1 Tax=Halteromyces radiatus TaxID=101107 RepID=UPI00221E973C|nr:uncharacterized protein BX664DRAFT_364628 [Halteromyces radiatus]KAI8092778.1 hypothetical protein BX664DRAFT_364628 [Halteromyces radiatus]